MLQEVRDSMLLFLCDQYLIIFVIERRFGWNFVLQKNIERVLVHGTLKIACDIVGPPLSNCCLLHRILVSLSGHMLWV
jgi:hypothetical protein